MRRVVWNGHYASVTATMALVVALGGTSYAAIKLPKNSVGNQQIKGNAVTSTKVKDGGLVRSDFKAGQLPSGPRGVTGASGPPGPPGVTGPAGGKAFGHLDYNTGPTVTIPPGDSRNVAVGCDSGMFATGGGVVPVGIGDLTGRVSSSFSSGAGGTKGWAARVHNDSATRYIESAAVVTCAPAEKTS